MFQIPPKKFYNINYWTVFSNPGIIYYEDDDDDEDEDAVFGKM